jgi:hypothetical protein
VRVAPLVGGKWIVITAIRPGGWSIPRQVVSYTENGNSYQHTFPIRYWGTVEGTAAVHFTADPAEAQCAKPERSRSHYLRNYHG